MTIYRQMGRFLRFFALTLLLLQSACTLTSEGAKRKYAQKGDKSYAAGNYAEAVLNYRKALQNDPRYGEAYYGLALAETQQRNVRAAYEDMTRAVDLLPNHPDAKVRLADLCLMLYLPDSQHPVSLYNQLTTISDQLLAQDPKSFDGLRIKGHLALTEKKTLDGVEFLQQANALRPSQPEVVVALTQGLVQLKRYAEAEKLALDLVRTHKSFATTYDILYGFYLSMNRPADAEKILRVKADNNPKVAGFITQLAAHYYMAGRVPEMQAALRRLTDHPQDFPKVHLILGDFYAGIGDFVEARRQLEQGVKEDPKSAEIYQKRIANLLLLQGKKDEAAALVDKILAQDPLDMGSVDVRAALLLESGSLEKIGRAVTRLTEATQKQKEDPVSRYLLGRALLARGDFGLANAQFMEAIKLQKDYLPPRIHLSEIGIQTRQFDRALRYANEVLALQPDSSRARLLRVMAQMGLGKSKEARTELAALIKERPLFIDAQLQLGLLDTSEKRFKEASQTFRALYRLDSADVRPLLGLVGVLVAQKQFDAALQLLSDEARRWPNSIAVRSELARTAVAAGKPDVGTEQYQQLASANPNVADFQVKLGELYFKRGEMDRAVTSLQRAHAIAPQDPVVSTRLASMLERCGRSDEAIAAYRQVLQLQPENPVVMNNLAYLLADSGKDLDEALALVQKAQQKMPDESVVADTIGWIYVKKGMRQSAIQIFGNLTRKEPTSPTYRYHYALSLFANGDTKKARAELQAALENHPSKAEESRIRELIAKAR